MTKTLRVLMIMMLAPIATCGQSESDNWYFGFGAGIHFNQDGSIDSLTDGQLNTYEGCATISDNSGALLFYTDGRTVYDRRHTVMANGQDLFGQPSSTQSAIIVPKPESPNIYYIITTNSQQAEIPNNGLNYSEVDMSLNNGNGQVILKNIKLLEDSSEKVTVAVKDCSENTLWLIALGSVNSGNRPFSTFHAFEINDSGIVLPSIQSPISDFQYVGGNLKISIDGTKIASANMSSGLFLYDFDSTTGRVTNEQEITIDAPSDNNAYGVEFSPNGNFLYVHASNDLPLSTGHTASLFQYNLLAPDISASQVVLDQSRGLYRAALQLGPNGKIYRSLTETYDRGTPFLGAINNPNELGLAAAYEHNAVSLNGRFAAQGLPAFVQSFLREADITSNELIFSENDLEICTDEELILKATYFPGANYVWEKDGMVIENEIMNTLLVPAAAIADTGNYQVTVYRPGSEACPLTAEGSVVVHALPEVIPYILTVCENANPTPATGLAEFDLTQIENDPNVVYTYYESIEAMNNDEFILDPQRYANTEPFDQYVYYKVINANGCENLDEIQLQVRPAPNVTLESIYTLCVDNPNLSLNVSTGFDTYAWYKLENNTERLVSTLSEIQIMEVGDYILRVGMNYVNTTDNIVCGQTMEFTVIPSNVTTIEEVIINDNTEINTVEIRLRDLGDYEFSIDGVVYQMSGYFEDVPSGSTTVYVRNTNGCGIIERTIEVNPALSADNFPKFFSPNGDDVNDFWQYVPVSSGDDDMLWIEIYTRYGQLLVQLNPDSKGWDGNFNGASMPSADYWFKAKSINNQIIQGHFSLIR